MVTSQKWRTVTAEQRRAWVRQGIRRHCGRGLCSRCWAAQDPNRSRANPDARHWIPATQVVEEYEFLTDQGMDLAEVAHRLGMRKDTLQRSLARARERGLLAA